METITDLAAKYLPGPGWLPTWTLVIASTAILNAIQNYTSDRFSNEVYSKGGLVNPLQRRLFAIWSLASGMVRVYGAMNITDPTIYNMTLATYIIAEFHFLSEILVFQTVGITRGSVPALAVATTSIIWMISQKAFYIGA